MESTLELKVNDLPEWQIAKRGTTYTPDDMIDAYLRGSVL